MRTCGTCGEPKPLTEFYYMRRVGAYKGQCKPCLAARERKRREEKHLALGRKRCPRCRRWREGIGYARRKVCAQCQEKEYWLASNLKRCTRCGGVKAKSEFPNNRAKPDGKYSWCRECCAARDLRARGGHLMLIHDSDIGVGMPTLGERPHLEASLQYACLKDFGSRPIPTGETKRRLFCSRCEASSCVIRRRLTPQEVAAGA